MSVKMAVKTRVIQSNMHTGPRQDGFFYDIAFPDMGLDLYEEIQDVIAEVIEEDIYLLSRFSSGKDVWVDAGSHVGLFSIAAIQSGAEVSCIIDMDSRLAFCALSNINSFHRQLDARRPFTPKPIEPFVIIEKIEGADILVEASMLPARAWGGGRRSCLKLDVQGSEADIFDGSGLSDLAAAYDLIVLEWHQPSAEHLLPVMESSGWKVERVQSHEDVLLGCKTSIIWATSG